MHQATEVDVNQRDWQEHDFRRSVDFHAVLLAIAGHDLRQHLQVILNTYGWLSEHVNNGLERERIERGQYAVVQMAEEPQQLITALPIHEKTGRTDMVPVCLGPLFFGLGQDVGDLALQRGVQLRVLPADAVIASDPVLLKRVIGNLVRTAVKFTAPNGRVLLGCRRRGRGICIAVHDTGIGIPSGRLQKIFVAFHRIDPTESNGFGLGFFFARRAVEPLQLRIEVQSTVGRESCFSILTNAGQGTIQADQDFAVCFVAQ
jgi:two-component system, OmpR family, phosphate regulon sensor histidine kinase PhoR